MLDPNNNRYSPQTGEIPGTGLWEVLSVEDSVPKDIENSQ